MNPALDVLQDNALKRRIGYNNLCVGFDTPPALYVASVMWVFVAYFAMKFAWCDMQRSILLRAQQTYFKLGFSIATDLLYMFAFAGFALVFVIHPWDTVWGHTFGFGVLIVVQ